MTVAEKRITGVELVKVGTWEASTGPWTVTRADIAAMIDAFTAGAVRKPPIKLGHTDERFDGTPSFGFVDKLRTTSNGDTLVGDLVMPAWLADAAPLHYPDRSVEAAYDFQDGAGTVWPLALTGLALLGEAAPAITSLDSLQDLVAASARKRVALTTSGAGWPDTGYRTTILIAAARRRRNQRKVL